MKVQKITFFQKNLQILERKLNNQWKAILLILPFKEISLWPKLSSPPHLRIQGGYQYKATDFKKKYKGTGVIATVLSKQPAQQSPFPILSRLLVLHCGQTC